MKLAHSFTLILTADSEGMLEHGIRLFSKLFSEKCGGATVVRGEGAWMHSTEGFVSEPNAQVIAYTNDNPKRMYHELRHILKVFLTDANQEAVALIVDGTMYIYMTDELPEYLV